MLNGIYRFKHRVTDKAYKDKTIRKIVKDGVTYDPDCCLGKYKMKLKQRRGEYIDE